MKTITDNRNYDSGYAPPCPICGMEPRKGDDGITFPCGHFIDSYSAWIHPDDIRADAARDATHCVSVTYETGGETEYFFRTTGTNTVMTASEVDARFSLPTGTAKLAANRGSVTARKSAGTWLIARSEAVKKWGRPAACFAIAIMIALFRCYVLG